MPPQLSVQKFIERSKAKYGSKYSYSDIPTQFEKGNKNATLTCTIHNNTFTCVIRSHLYDSKTGGCKQCASAAAFRPSQKKCDSEKQNTREILVSPVKNICSCTIWDRTTKDGQVKKKFAYYTKFEEHSKIHKNITENEINKLKQEYDSKCVKFSDIFRVKICDLTPHIVKYYRWIQPKIEYEYTNVPIDPYILGLWLGDGWSDRVSLTNIDKNCIVAWENFAKLNNLFVNKCNKIKRTTKSKEHETDIIYSYHIVDSLKKTNHNSANKLFRSLNLLKNKHIPEIYLKNSVEIRKQLLAGLIDTDGHLCRNVYDIVQKNEKLSNNIFTLAQSLGFNTKIKKVNKTCCNNDKTNIYFKVNIGVNQHSPNIPVKCERKKLDIDSKIMITNPRIDIHGNVVEREIKNDLMNLKELLS